MSSRPAGMPTKNPAIQVEKSGVRNRGWTRPKMRGSRPSRGMANHTRAWPGGMTAGREDETRWVDNKDQDGDDFEQNHDVVGFGRFANAAHQDGGEDHHDDERRPIEAEMPAGSIERVSLQVG